MPAGTSGRTALQATLTAIGVVAVGAGLDGVIRGAQGVHRGGDVSANVDSELRFFAAWYAVAGALALRSAQDPDRHATTVQACAAGFGLAAAGRVLSWRRLGPPSPGLRWLLGSEAVLATTLVPWQRRVARP